MLVHGWPFVQMDDGFWRLWPVPEGAVRALGVVVVTPRLNNNLGLTRSLTVAKRSTPAAQPAHSGVSWASGNDLKRPIQEIVVPGLPDRRNRANQPPRKKFQMRPSQHN